jgi:hypothetical protein
MMVAAELSALLESGTQTLDLNAHPRICGIYFLMKGRQVVYVGQSVDIIGRCMEHRACIQRNRKRRAAGIRCLSVGAERRDSQGFGFDGVRYIEIDEERLDEYEQRFISHFAPVFNGPALTKSYRRKYGAGLPPGTTS